jgi:hypothetical protein
MRWERTVSHFAPFEQGSHFQPILFYTFGAGSVLQRPISLLWNAPVIGAAASPMAKETVGKDTSTKRTQTIVCKQKKNAQVTIQQNSLPSPGVDAAYRPHYQNLAQTPGGFWISIRDIIYAD